MCSFDIVELLAGHFVAMGAMWSDGCFRCCIALRGMVFIDMVDGGMFFAGLLDGLLCRHRRGMFLPVLGLARGHRRTFSLP